MLEERTSRLRLVAGTLETAKAESEDRRHLSALLQAAVPADWPPEILRDALPVFLELHSEHPDWVGWLGWYAIRIGQEAAVLCGSVGFKGPPDATGAIEIGYSVLPAYQRAGLATEMVAGLVAWAGRQPGVWWVEAETTVANVGSIRVLERNGFQSAGQGVEAGTVRYRRSANL